MIKQFKRILAIVCALAMAITGMAIAPATANAEDYTEIPNQTHVVVGNYDLFAVAEDGSKLGYLGSGAVGDTSFKMIASPGNDSGDKEYSSSATILNATALLEADHSYNAKVKITATKKGTIPVTIEGVEQRIKIKDEDVNQSVEFDLGTFDHDLFVKQEVQNKISFYFGMMPTNTEISIDDISFEEVNKEWVPVPNVDPAVGGYATHVGMFDLSAMYSSNAEYGMYGKMKYHKLDEGQGDQLADTKVQVNSTSGWLGAYAVTAQLRDYCKNEGLLVGDIYDVEIEVNSSKATGQDELHHDKKLRVIVDGNIYDVKLDGGDQTIEIKNMKYNAVSDPKYPGTGNITFCFDQLEKGTEFYVKSITFTNKEDQQGWKDVENGVEKIFPNETDPVMSLFAYNGGTSPIGMWGRLKYKLNGAATEADVKNPEDVLVKVKSSSGWLNAYATMAQYPGYLDRVKDVNGNNLVVGQQYKINFSIDSDKTTGITDEGDYKYLQLTMDSDSKGNDYTKYLRITQTGGQDYEFDDFTYEGFGDNVLFELDQIDADTTLKFSNIEFTPIGEWTPVSEYTTVGSWGLLAQMNAQTETWGKMSYKTTGDPAEALGNTEMLIRSSSGWNNPVCGVSARIENLLTTAGIEEDDEYYIEVEATYTKADPTETYSNLIVNVDDKDIINGYTQKGDDQYPYTARIKNGANSFTVGSEAQPLLYTENSGDVIFNFDQLQRNDQIKITKVNVVKVDSEYKKVPNNTATTAGRWTLNAVVGTSQAQGQYGKMRYKTTDDTVSGTEMYLASVSGWVDARALMGTLRGYTTEKNLTVDKTYAALITFTYDKATKLDTEEEANDVLRATIDGVNYDFKVRPGTNTYVVPSFQYKGTNTNVVFDFDELQARSYVHFDAVEFDDAIDIPTGPNAIELTDLGNGDVQVVCDPQYIYPEFLENEAQHKQPATYNNKYVYYVDEVEYLISGDPVVTLEDLPAGEHVIGVAGVNKYGVKSGVSASDSIVVSRPTMTPSTTAAPTTEAPTTQPTTTKVAPTTKPVKIAKPAKVKIKKIAKKKKSAKKLTVTVKKAARAKGYQVKVYTSKKKAKKNKKAIVTKTYKKTKFTIKSNKLKKKKKLFVRVRAYNFANGKNGKKQYGAWSAIKKVKIKK